MRSRLLRLVGVVMGLLALLVSTAPPVPAFSTRTATIGGDLVLAAPLGYPCTGTKTTPGTAKCPPTTPSLDTNLPLPDDPRPNFHPHFGNTIPILAVDDLFCTDDGTNVDKPGKAPAHAGACTSTLLGNPKNHIHGYCGLNGGQMVWRFVDALGQAWTLDIHFTGLPPLTTLTGHATKVSTGRTGKLTGGLLMVPVPGKQVTPPGLTNSCGSKSAREFTFVGRLEWQVVTFI